LTVLNEYGEPENATNMRQPISAVEMQNEMTNGFVISSCQPTFVLRSYLVQNAYKSAHKPLANSSNSTT
jgi:hypothetical protein